MCFSFVCRKHIIRVVSVRVEMFGDRTNIRTHMINAHVIITYAYAYTHTYANEMWRHYGGSFFT